MARYQAEEGYLRSDLGARADGVPLHECRRIFTGHWAPYVLVEITAAAQRAYWGVPGRPRRQIPIVPEHLPCP